MSTPFGRSNYADGPAGCTTAGVRADWRRLRDDTLGEMCGQELLERAGDAPLPVARPDAKPQTG